ncbi:Cytochrome c oxidase subunit 6B [Bulinus truncatus]|nr:Cytochrome c oxidase subunit 6B [Bulinus truncatus]
MSDPAKPCPPKLPKPCPSNVPSSNVEEKVAEEKKEPRCIKLWGPGFDARFPNQNITRRCWQNYVDYFRCTTKFEDDERCEYFKKTYKHLCPGFWIEHWDDQRSDGTFPMPRWA